MIFCEMHVYIHVAPYIEKKQVLIKLCGVSWTIIVEST